MIVRGPSVLDRDREITFMVEHDTERAALLPEPFLSDHRHRFDPAYAVPVADAAAAVHYWTDGAHVVGAVPDFDTSRLAPLLRAAGLEPGWHYHLIDIETLAVGYLHGAGRGAELLQRPWDSDVLSRLVGVEPPVQGQGRHTALGDARWARDVWDAVTAKSW